MGGDPCHMELILFDSWDERCKKPFGAVSEGTVTEWTIRLHLQYGAKAVLFWLAEDGAEPSFFRMQWIGTEDAYDVFRFSHSLKVGLYWYSFSFLSKDGTSVCVRRDGLNRPVPKDGDCWQQTVYAQNLPIPSHIRGGVMYQIFPDRFARCGEVRVPPEKAYATLHSCMTDLPNHVRSEDGSLDTTDFFGGNLWGITEKLPYLHDLGVTVLYLNPIFLAHSNHRYDTGDYERIDPFLGDEDDLRTLCECAHRNGISVVLDGVFNHTGDDSRYFNRYGTFSEIGAAQSVESPYYNWYTFTCYPDVYRAWWGVKILPAVRSDHPSFLQYITETVVPKWMKCGVSGWRLDVADELSDVFLDRFYRAVKEEKTDSYVILEVWEDASSKISYGMRRRYLLGGQTDSVMNYVWKDAILQFLQDGDGMALHRSVMTLYEHYPKPVSDVLMNLLGTHDTVRILTLLDGRVDLVKLGFLLISTLPGIPCVYYGDEVGMAGGEDPLNRRFYQVENGEILEFLRHLFWIRRKESVFVDGVYRLWSVGNGSFCFLRGDSVLIAINCCREPAEIPLPRRGVDLFAEKEIDCLFLAPYSGTVCKFL